MKLRATQQDLSFVYEKYEKDASINRCYGLRPISDWAQIAFSLTDDNLTFENWLSSDYGIFAKNVNESLAWSTRMKLEGKPQYVILLNVYINTANENILKRCDEEER